MTDQKCKLSDRLRPDVECAPWVIDEVRKLEAAYIDALSEIRRLEALRDLSYANGIAAGWNCETAEQRIGLMDSLRGPALKALKALKGHAAAPGPDCGACPGDGSVCTESCRLADESPDAPEPVCRWRNPQSRENGYSWVAECGLEWDFGSWDANPGNSDVTFCPRCGKKVEVVKDE